MVNRPSWAKPVKLDSSMALKPQTEVSMPRRSVDQMRDKVTWFRSRSGLVNR